MVEICMHEAIKIVYAGYQCSIYAEHAQLIKSIRQGSILKIKLVEILFIGSYKLWVNNWSSSL